MTRKGKFYELVYVWAGGDEEVRDIRRVEDIDVAKNHLRTVRLARKLGRRLAWYIRRVNYPGHSRSMSRIQYYRLKYETPTHTVNAHDC